MDFEDKEKKEKLLLKEGLAKTIDEAEEFLKVLAKRFGNILLNNSIEKFEKFLENNKVIVKKKVEEGKLWQRKTNPKKSKSKKTP